MTVTQSHEDALINSETLQLTEKGKKAMTRKKSKEEIEAMALHKEAEANDKLREQGNVKAKAEPKEPKFGPTEVVVTGIKAKLTVGTNIYSRKAMDDKPIVMKAETELIIKKLADIGPTGTNVVSVRKEGSKRIFYTVLENITCQGILVD